MQRYKKRRLINTLKVKSKGVQMAFALAMDIKKGEQLGSPFIFV